MCEDVVTKSPSLDHQVGAYSKLLGLWSPLYRSMDCNAATIVHLPDFDQLTVANLVNLLLMEEPPLGYVRFTLEQMELFQCLDIKLNGITEIPADVEIKKVEPKDKKRATRSGINVVQASDKVVTQSFNGASPLEVETEEQVNYMCDLCDSKTGDIKKHMESEHEEIMPIPMEEIAAFFKIIQSQTKAVLKKPEPLARKCESTDDEPTSREAKVLEKKDSGSSSKLSNVENSGTGRSASDDFGGVKCPYCQKMFAKGGSRLKDNLKCHIGLVHFGPELLSEVQKFYVGNKCKECGHNGKDSSMKKKHLLFNHTEYVAKVLKLIDEVIQSKKDGKVLKLVITPESKQNNEGVELAKDPNSLQTDQKSKDTDDKKELNGSKRKREESGDSEQGKKHLKVIDLKKLTEVPLAHAEVEDLLMSDEDDNLEKNAGPEEENLSEFGPENINDEVDTDLDPQKGQETEVLSIQDQLLQMQDLSSEEDEDEDANNRLNEFVGEDLSEVECEDLANEKVDDETMAFKNRNGDYDIDVGYLVSDEDIADDISDEVCERLSREQAACDFEDDKQMSLDKATANTNDDSVGDPGNISDDEEDSMEKDEDTEEDNLEEVLNFQNGESDSGEEDDDDDAETAPNSEREDESQMCKDSKSVLSTEILEKLDNLLNS